MLKTIIIGYSGFGKTNHYLIIAKIKRRKNMKIVKQKQAQKFEYATTSSVLDYSMKLNEKNMDFCINSINGRYPERGYCSNLECEELCYILDGRGTIFKRDNSIEFEKGDIVFINKKDVYYWQGNFKVALVCSPAWSKEQVELYEE